MENLKAYIVENIKNNLQILRKTNGLTMREVAKAMDIKENTYRIWEDKTKDSIPKAESLVLLASIYNVSVDFLMRTEANNRYDVPLKVCEADDVYGDKYLNELSPQEKLTVMKTRRMSSADRQRVFDLIDEILGEKR